jgi:hypothetical protein
MKYIFLWCEFGNQDVDISFYIIGQTSKSLILIKNYMHPILG